MHGASVAPLPWEGPSQAVPATTNGTATENVSITINGTNVLSNFDIYASAGGQNKAVVREFTATSNSSGQIVVQFTTVTDNASISGMEIFK